MQQRLYILLPMLYSGFEKTVCCWAVWVLLLYHHFTFITTQTPPLHPTSAKTLIPSLPPQSLVCDTKHRRRRERTMFEEIRAVRVDIERGSQQSTTKKVIAVVLCFGDGGDFKKRRPD
ncbi:hypothetical protein HanRHA438_Chr14g0645491 [Helianthus annuus]|nr:hypothetical protein HanHA89_Chr14g0564051 [Helianthus annuus]KAJ0655624.1 hypothetical protein HanLR1_Chr14g0526391 [Helianthus annuus]KAJ0659311.1 hypothetical protein HanOQP8_Chr14g0524631 [Helianthus annuus]KAJ0852943.1 hypothetical protein HanRHA438_Chr14g0645491 [Helianthus annuus]